MNYCRLGFQVCVSLDLLLQGSFEELEQQVLLSLVGGVVIQGEDYRVHELCGLILWHLEDQLGEIRGVGLKGSRNLIKYYGDVDWYDSCCRQYLQL